MPPAASGSGQLTSASTTASVPPAASGLGQLTSASTTVPVPPAVAPLTLGDDDLQRIVEELHQHMGAGSGMTSTSTPKRSRRKVWDLHQEVETDAQ